ncbi:MAG: hypothetical protein LBG22_09020, partial [Treponema sp.]|nr:hypothetical protein [Treponema sp.]
MFRYILPLLFLAGLSRYPLAAQNDFPLWYLDKESQYPGRSYIASLGEGKTIAEAEAAAVSQVSLFFNTSTEVRKEAIREFNEALINNTTEFSKKTYISENAVITSEQEFLGIRFTNPWQDQKRGVWVVLAYIDRREAAQMYDSKIAANMAAINSLEADAENQSETLYAVSLLYRGLRLCDITEEFIRTAAVVDTSAGKRHEPDTAKIQALRSEYRAKKDRLSFSIKMRSPENSGRVERRLADLFEDNGFVVASAPAMYTLNVRITAEEETNNAGNFVTPGITVRVERDGKTLFSYNKNYERSGHRT